MSVTNESVQQNEKKEKPDTPMLDVLELQRVFSVEPGKNRTAVIFEECDHYFSSILTREEYYQMIEELTRLGEYLYES